MPAIKDISTIAAKWAVVAGRSGDAYQEGVEAPRKDWKSATQAATANWEAGTQQAITRKSFRAGVDKSSTETWKRGAIDKGVSRYTVGVTLSADKYQRGFQPYAETIKATTLPERYPKGDSRNINRVSIMSKALHDKKLSLLGTTK
jgi:hypothetical protein